MAAVYDDIDIEFGYNGDFELGGNGDVKVNDDDALQSLLDQIHSLCASVFRDWVIYPNRAAGLDDFMGEPNTSSSAIRIHDRLRLTIISAGIVRDEDLDIRIVPVHAHKVLAVVKIDAMPTSFNQLEATETLQTAIVFDFLEQGVFFLNRTPKLTSW